MKALTLAILATSSLAIVSVPVSARTGEVVDFTYKAKELANEKSRAVLLKRMKATTNAACAGKKARAYINSKKCAQDLEQQFIAAISHPQLVAQYEGKPVRIARNGR